MSLFDKAEIAIPCPQCGHESKKTIGWMKSHENMQCPGCGSVITLDSAELKKGIASAEKSLKDFGKNLSRLGKR